MIKPANNKLIVRVDPNQKNEIKIGNTTLTTALLFENNYRERSPVVGVIVHGNDVLREGDVALFHHNHFYQPSPYWIGADLFSVPFNKTIFGILNENGEIDPLCGNIICERVPIEYAVPVPIEERKTYLDRAIVVNPGDSAFEKGQLLFHKYSAGYDIVYNWKGEERRKTKVHSDMIVGWA